MSHQNPIATHTRTPTLFRESTAFLMKARYQRHMLYGWVVALVVVLLPALVLSYWPAPEVPVVVDDDYPAPRDTFVVDMGRDYEVVLENPLQPGGGGQPRDPGDLGNVAPKVTLVPDNITLESSLSFGGDGGGTPGPDDGLDDGDFWSRYDRGAVFIPDTAEYQMHSSELDRIPSLVKMDQPSYPPLAKRAGLEGKVILWVLVNEDGRAAEVRVHQESNPGYGFGEYAAETARKAVFVPAIAHKQPVRCWVSIPVVFELE